MRKKIEKIFWDMEIIGNRRKIHFSTAYYTLAAARETESVVKTVDPANLDFKILFMLWRVPLNQYLLLALRLNSLLQPSHADCS